MQETTIPNFTKANLTVQEVAKVMRKDPQVVRIMIQNGLVPWGQCIKMPGSSQYSYLISPLKFWQETGVIV